LGASRPSTARADPPFPRSLPPTEALGGRLRGNDSAALLTVSNLNQYYGGSHILRDISFQVPMGEVTVLLGRNGVGKTTLLKTLMGLVPAARGSIRFDDRDITRLAPYHRARAGLGYVPQGREIFPRLTVEENLQMGLASAPRNAAVPSRIFELFPVLASMLRRRGGDLSGGQQQQLAIGRALAMNPRLLILDEPTEGIQPSIIKDIERVIRMLAEQGGMAILLVEQYYDFARSLADHYLVMERGELVQHGRGADMDADGVRSRVAV
jgi:urea transport system ATP-binding protein